jgi:hypothetical protein
MASFVIANSRRGDKDNWSPTGFAGQTFARNPRKSAHEVYDSCSSNPKAFEISNITCLDQSQFLLEIDEDFA